MPDEKVAVRACLLMSHMMSDIAFAAIVPPSLALEAHMMTADVLTVHSREGRLALRAMIIVMKGDYASSPAISPMLKLKAARFVEKRATPHSIIGIAAREIIQQNDTPTEPVRERPLLPESEVTNLAWFRARQGRQAQQLDSPTA
jgi:hypothetical protein